MATTLTRSLELEPADANALLTVLRQHHGTWSAGLTKDLYIDFLKYQLTQPWARRNFRYFVARKQGDIVSSIKLYTLEIKSRHRTCKVAGIGGVFTAEHARGRGYANEMMELVIKRCQKEGYDASLLFSDIDPLFYERLGFELLPDDDFHIWVNDPQLERSIMSGPDFISDIKAHAPDVVALTPEFIPDMVRHHRRYLERQPYGIVRDEIYWDYKLKRSLYRVDKVVEFPQLELMTLEFESNQGGYAVFEQGGQIMRVLEVIGSEDTRDTLWRHILRTALLRGVQLVRGWEAAAPNFRRHLRYTERSDWARPMLLPFNKDCEQWLDYDICPLLELDHF